MTRLRVHRAELKNTPQHLRVHRAELLTPASGNPQHLRVHRAELFTPQTLNYLRVHRAELLTPPAADAGADQGQIEPDARVTLTGADEYDVGTTRTWVQLSGPTVTLVGTGKVRIFDAPATMTGADLVFQYTAGASAPDTVKISVYPSLEFFVDAAGVVRPLKFFLA